jgi:hypothetical protein
MARTAGVFYLLNVATTLIAIVLFRHSVWPGFALKMSSTEFSLVVAVLLYVVLASVSRGISLFAALFRVAACIVAALGHLSALAKATPLPVPLPRLQYPVTNIVVALFGFHFLLLGYLIFRSNFLPRGVGLLVIIAGAGAIPLMAPVIAKSFFLYFAPIGLAAEVAITVSLLMAKGGYITVASPQTPVPRP